ncbi:hypothetical protein KM043_015994 [Ampulex compressa]|nr:hypothetical protein KM043_015994 [Ampulex compressa]
MYTPKIIWYQTDVTVVIRIMLYDLKDYFLRVMRDHLLFSTTMNDRDYYVCLYLFGTVMAEKTTHVNKGREIEVRLIKAHKWTMWLRLQIEKDKNPHIIADSANLYEIDWTMNPDEIDDFRNINVRITCHKYYQLYHLQMKKNLMMITWIACFINIIIGTYNDVKYCIKVT